MGVFTYSQEDDTPAADMPNQIDEEVKQERLNQLMIIQQDIAFEKNNSLLESVQRVMIDTIEDGRAIGRTYADCPEVDLEVVINNADAIKIGDMLDVKIIAVDGYDIFGEVVKG